MTFIEELDLLTIHTLNLKSHFATEQTLHKTIFTQKQYKIFTSDNLQFVQATDQ